MRCPSCHRRVAARCPLHPSAEPPPSPAPVAVPRVAGFEGLTPLGHGGFARVYAARREVDGRDVALKVLQPLAADRLGRELDALRLIGPPVVPELLGQVVTRIWSAMAGMSSGRSRREGMRMRTTASRKKRSERNRPRSPRRAGRGAWRR